MTLEQLFAAMLAFKSVHVEGRGNFQGIFQEGRVTGINMRAGLVWVDFQVRDNFIMSFPYGAVMFR